MTPLFWYPGLLVSVVSIIAAFSVAVLEEQRRRA